jgi:hypothetical protein
VLRFAALLLASCALFADVIPVAPHRPDGQPPGLDLKALIRELTLNEGADEVTCSERVGAVPRLLTLTGFDWLGDEGGFVLTGAVVWSRDSLGPTELEFPAQLPNGADIPVSGGDPVLTSPAAVPEPRAILLLGTAAAGLLLSRSVRRKVSSPW